MPFAICFWLTFDVNIFKESELEIYITSGNTYRGCGQNQTVGYTGRDGAKEVKAIKMHSIMKNRVEIFMHHNCRVKNQFS